MKFITNNSKHFSISETFRNTYIHVKIDPSSYISVAWFLHRLSWGAVSIFIVIVSWGGSRIQLKMIRPIRRKRNDRGWKFREEICWGISVSWAWIDSRCGSQCIAVKKSRTAFCCPWLSKYGLSWKTWLFWNICFLRCKHFGFGINCLDFQACC